MIRVLLVLTNIVCFILHILLEIILWNVRPAFGGFLLIENALISLLYLFFAWSVWTNKRELSSMILHVLFWVCFTIFTIVIRPTETALEAIYAWIKFPQWIALFFTGILMSLLSIMNIFQQGEARGK
ncbi:hypothetical protein FACS189418_1970 [Clostridia bacterium]|nr:hypothetical protein FACS189418_1970 [Clostridia bacterium]